MRVIHVVPGITEEASGPSYSVPRLCESLIGAGVDLQLAGRIGKGVYASQLAVSENIPLGSRPWALYVLKQWCQLNNGVL
jgi:hypothetical protein